MTRLAIFDCDGTLVDSGGTIHRALAAAFAVHGHACPPQSVTRKIIGLSLDEAMAALIPEADHAALSATYKDAFIAMRGAGEVEESLFDGMVDLLDALAADGWLLGVATGKSDRGLRHCLAAHGIADRFITLQTADRNPSKPHPAMALAAMAAAGALPGDTVFIGDTGWDMGCARAAKCGAIGVGWGYHDHDEMIVMGAHHVADAPGEIVALANKWVKCMTDDAMWKRRFFTLMLARLSGTVLALLGLLVGFTDVFQPGGFRVLGILLVAAGLIDLAVLPMILRKHWRQP